MFAKSVFYHLAYFVTELMHNLSDNPLIVEIDW